MPGAEKDVFDHSFDPVGIEEGRELFAPLKPYPHIALAVSGGSDSVAMMWLMARWAGQLATPPCLHILSVDHGLRERSAYEAEQTGKWAGALGLRHHILRWRGVKPQSGVQAAAREARYSLMLSWCRTNDIDALLVAHHLDDQAETVMMRFLKGSGIDGLCGMRGASWREGVRLMRPLLGVRKARLVVTLEDAQHAWLEDPGNEDVKYERVRIRRALKSLEDEGLSSEKICQSAGSLSHTRDGLDALANALIEKGVEVSRGGFCHMDEALIRAAGRETGLRVLRRALMAIGGAHHPPARGKLSRLYNQVIMRGGAGATLAGCSVFRQAERLWIVREMRDAVPLGTGLAEEAASAWDNRFIVQAPGAGYQVRALGAEGWVKLKEALTDMEQLPAAAGQSLVSFWRGNELAAVPYLGYCGSGEEHGIEGFRARFFQKQPLLLTY